MELYVKENGFRDKWENLLYAVTAMELFMKDSGKMDSPMEKGK